MTAKLYVEIDPTELACRIAEGMVKAKRPSGMSAEKALEAFEPAAREDFQRAARNAAIYFGECVKNGVVPS